MIRTIVKAVSVAAVAALALTAAGTAAAGPAVLGADNGTLDAAASAYLKVYPQMSPDAAKKAAEGQQARKTLYTELTTDGGKTFGGAWFDPPAGVLHIATSSSDQAAKATTAGDRLGLRVQTHIVERSYADLERAADAIRNGTDELSRAARGQVGIDVQTNKVVVAVPAAQRVQLAGVAPTGVDVVADPGIQAEADAGCTTRDACDWTIRAGAMIWAGAKPDDCSVGFTARTSANVRYTLTAGHCSSGNGVTWGTGAQFIGPMEASVDAGALDAARIRVTNPWFTGDSGGEIYVNWDADRSVDVDFVAPTLGYIQAGETVCLSANYTDPGGPNLCGVIGTNSDPAVRGMARVDGLDACGGDSGGGWYWLTGQPAPFERVAYGLHSRSDAGCHGDQGGTRSWFSPIPTVRGFWPDLTVEVR